MAFANIDTLSWGKALQIAFDKGFRVQISRDFRDFEFIQRHKTDDRMAREYRFQFVSDLGIASVQMVDPGTRTTYPTQVTETLGEKTAVFKEMAATVELEQNLIERLKLSKDLKYGDPLTQKLEYRMTGMKRIAAAALHGDGTGVVGQVGATACVVDSPTSANVRFYLAAASETNTARGAVGHFQPGDILILKATAGGASAFDSSLGTEPVYWAVISRRRSDDSVLLQGQSAVGTPVATITSISTPASAGDVFYRYAQTTIPNLSSVGDYGTATQAMPGLDSLAAADGRTVHGIVMVGSSAGTRLDASAVSLNSGHLEDVMNNVKINVGEGAYAWKMALACPEAVSILIKSGETDRRFAVSDDIKRGSKNFTYQHRNDSIILQASEFAPKNRLTVIPEGKSGTDVGNSESVLEYHGTDFFPVEVSGQTLFLKPSSSGGFTQSMISMMQGYGTLIAKHPAAIGVVENFLVS